jgi:hypothetical protein
MWLRSVRLILPVMGICCAAATYSQPREDYFIHSETLQPVTYLIPDFAVLSDVSITPGQDGHLISLTMEANLPTNLSDRGRMVMEVWFRHHASAPLQYERAAVYVAGGIEYPSDSRLSPGQAGLIKYDWDKHRAVKLASIEVQVTGNQVLLRVPSDLLSGYEPLMAVVRYLPGDVNLEHVGGGFGMCTSSTRLLDDRLSGGSIVLPPFPPSFISKISFVQDGEGGGNNRVRNRDDRRPFPFVIPPSRRGTPGEGVPVPIPDTSPPSDPDRWPRPGDINGDGVRDYDYPSDTKVVGYILIDVWVVPTSDTTADYVLVIGKDTNGNGRLDVGEIWYPIGECPWPNGVNEGYIGTDGKIYWESWNDSNQNGNWDPGEQKKTYIYKPETGELVVIFDPDGPGGQPPREVYRGDPNGYYWHHR